MARKTDVTGRKVSRSLGAPPFRLKPSQQQADAAKLERFVERIAKQGVSHVIGAELRTAPYIGARGSAKGFAKWNAENPSRGVPTVSDKVGKPKARR